MERFSTARFIRRHAVTHLVTPDYYQTACCLELAWKSEKLIRGETLCRISCRKCLAWLKAYNS